MGDLGGARYSFGIMRIREGCEGHWRDIGLIDGQASELLTSEICWACWRTAATEIGGLWGLENQRQVVTGDCG